MLIPISGRAEHDPIFTTEMIRGVAAGYLGGQTPMRPYLEAAQAAGQPGVVAVGVAQEFQRVFSGQRRKTDKPGAVCYGFEKADRRVSCHYFLSVAGSLVNGELGSDVLLLCCWLGMADRAEGQDGAPRSAARTNDLDAGEGRGRIGQEKEQLASRHGHHVWGLGRMTVAAAASRRGCPALSWCSDRTVPAT